MCTCSIWHHQFQYDWHTEHSLIDRNQIINNLYIEVSMWNKIVNCFALCCWLTRFFCVICWFFLIILFHLYNTKRNPITTQVWCLKPLLKQINASKMYCIIPNRQFTCKGGYLSQVVPRKCCCLHNMEFFEAYSNIYCIPQIWINPSSNGTCPNHIFDFKLSS